MTASAGNPQEILQRLRALPRRTGGKRGGPRWLRPLTPEEGAAIQADEAERLAVGRELARLNEKIRDDTNKCTWYPGYDDLHPLRVPDENVPRNLRTLQQIAEAEIVVRTAERAAGLPRKKVVFCI